jgi:hypothetical protein
MLFIKFIMCLGTIIVIGTMTSCNAINGGSGKKHGDASHSNPGDQRTEFSNTPLKTADLTGATQNTFEIFSYSQQDGLWRLGSAAFQIQVPGPGTFIILSTGINSKTCSPDQARTSFALFEVNDSGALANMRPLDTQFPLVFYEAKTLQLQVDTAVKAHCTSLSPAEVFVTTKYISQEKDSLPGGNVPSEENPNQPQNPSGPGQPGHPGNPTRPLPTPLTCDGKPWPTDLPPVYKSKIRLWATPSFNEGCKNTFTWSVAETARLDPLSECAAPTIAIEQPQDQFIKISESFSSHRMQLLWLLTQSASVASQIKEQMIKGETIDLTYEGDHCLTATGTPQLPKNFEKLTSPTDYLLFRGDSREEGISKNCGLSNFQTLEPKKTSAGLNEIAATYDYRENTTDSFFYKLDFKFIHSPDDLKSSWKAALFNRKTHVYIEPWKQLEGANSFQNSITLKNPEALRRLLPNQEHIELVIRPKDDCKPGDRAEQKIYDLGALFSGNGGEQYFRDLKYPEQSRFLLTEDDLPF